MRASGSTSRRAGLAALLTSGVVAAAVLVPSSAQAATTSVSGTVTVDGRAVAGAPVGTWNPSRGVLTQGRTDAKGRFSLHSPSGVAVTAWVGAKPSASHAVFALGERHLVRGVVGDAQPKGVASPLWQRTTPVVPSRLGTGGVVRFRLENAGRFTSPVADGGTGRVALQRGGAYGPWYRAQDGTITSGWLVPGTYTVYWDPKRGRLPARTRVAVTTGTVRLAPSALPVLPVGTTVRIHATSGGSPLPAGVPVIEHREDGSTGTIPSTDATGTATGVSRTPGRYEYTVGVAFKDPDEGYGGGQPSSDDYLPATVSVDVAAGQAAADATVDLAPASKLRGTVTLTQRSAIHVFVEDLDGTAVREGYPDTTGAFTIGGLRAGTYSVLAEDLATHRYDRVAVTVGAGATADLPRALTPATPDPVLSGTVSGGRPGSVGAQARVTAYGLSLAGDRVDYSASGAYRIALPPGRFTLTVEQTGRADRTAATLLVDGTSVHRDLQPGPKRATAVVRFAVRGNPVRPGYAALGADGEELDLVARTKAGADSSTAVPPGTYTWTPPFTLPAADGPWTYSRPAPASFTLKAGAKQDLGTLRVTIRG